MLKKFEDIGFVVICDKNINSDYGYSTTTGVNFTVYESDAADEITSLHHPIDELFSVFIKWDGCSNWVMDNFHFCGLQEIKNFSILIDRLCELSIELMPEHKEDLF